MTHAKYETKKKTEKTYIYFTRKSKQVVNKVIRV